MTDDEFRQYFAETFSNPEVMFVTFARAGETWNMRRYTRPPTEISFALSDSDDSGNDAALSPSPAPVPENEGERN